MIRIESSSLSLREIAFITLAVIPIYLFTACGYVDTIDAEASIEAAKALVDHGSFGIYVSSANPVLFAKGKDGRFYSKLGILMPVLYAPLVKAARALSTQLDLPESVLIHALVSFLNPLLSSLLIGLLFGVLRSSGCSFKESIYLAGTAAFTTLVFPYSKTSHREPIQALFLLVVYAGALGSHSNYLLSGVCCALGILTKQAFIVSAIPALLLLLAGSVRRRDARSSILLFFPVLLSGIAWSLFSQLAFGTALESGYSSAVMTLKPGVWSTPLFSGLHQQFTSVDSGFFVNNPVLVLPLLWLVWKATHRKLLLVDWSILAAFLLQGTLYAKWAFPTGGCNLGPRYLIVVLPLAFLLVRDFLPHLLKHRGFTSLSLVLLIISFGMQVTSVCVRPQQFWTLKQRASVTVDYPHWLANMKFFAHKFRGQKEIYTPSAFGLQKGVDMNLEDVRTLKGFNFWWLHARRFQESADSHYRTVAR